MSSGGHKSFSFVARWNEEAATLEACEHRVKLLVSSTKEGDRCVVRDISLTQTDLQLEAVDGSGAQIIVKTVRLSVGPKSTLEGVRLLSDFFRRDSLLRKLR